jgi:hypothetical protein
VEELSRRLLFPHHKMVFIFAKLYKKYQFCNRNYRLMHNSLKKITLDPMLTLPRVGTLFFLKRLHIQIIISIFAPSSKGSGKPHLGWQQGVREC